MQDHADTSDTVHVGVTRAKNLECPGGCRGSGWRFERVSGVGDRRRPCSSCNPRGEPETTTEQAPVPRELPKNLKCQGGCRGSGEVWVVTEAGDRKAPCAECRPTARAEFAAAATGPE